MAKHVLAILLHSYLVFNFRYSLGALNHVAEDTKEFFKAKAFEDGNNSIKNRGNLDLKNEKTLDFFINEMETNIKQFVDTSLTQIDQTLSSIRSFACEQLNKGVSRDLCLLARKTRSSLLLIVGKVKQYVTTNFVKNVLRTPRSVGNSQELNSASSKDGKSEVLYSLKAIAEFANERGIFEADVNDESKRVRRQKGNRTNSIPADITFATPASAAFPVVSAPQKTLDNVKEITGNVTSISNKLTGVIDLIRSLLEKFTTGRKKRETKNTFAALNSSIEDVLDKLVYHIKKIFNNCRKPDCKDISIGSRRRRSFFPLVYPKVPTRKRVLPQKVNNSLKDVAAAAKMVSNRRKFISNTPMKNPQENDGSPLMSLLQLPGNIVRSALKMSRNVVKTTLKLVSSNPEEFEKVKKRL